MCTCVVRKGHVMCTCVGEGREGGHVNICVPICLKLHIQAMVVAHVQTPESVQIFTSIGWSDLVSIL